MSVCLSVCLHPNHNHNHNHNNERKSPKHTAHNNRDQRRCCPTEDFPRLGRCCRQLSPLLVVATSPGRPTQLQVQLRDDAHVQQRARSVPRGAQGPNGRAAPRQELPVSGTCECPRSARLLRCDCAADGPRDDPQQPAALCFGRCLLEGCAASL